MTEQTDSGVPQHLGLILDGNRRWAKERGQHLMRLLTWALRHEVKTFNREDIRLRVSNFMLWGSAYGELVFDKINWPDFDEKRLVVAFDEYAWQRRFGS